MYKKISMEAQSRQHCKIRKRGNSSSSSSSLLQKYRFKRAILVGKKGGSTTPVPTWMTSTLPPSGVMPNAGCPSSETGSKPTEVSVSARKLAATLWEINKIPSPATKMYLEDKKELRSKGKLPTLPRFFDPSDNPILERVDRSREHSHLRRASIVAKKLHLCECNPGVLGYVGNTSSLMEIETHINGTPQTECVIGIKARLKDVSNGLTTSKEFLKLLNDIYGLDKQNSSGMSVFSALRIELDRVRIQVNQLIKEQRHSQSEIECLTRHFEQEKAAGKNKRRERIRNAIACIAEDLEVEKKLRRQTERLNKKLGKELADMKASLSKAIKELESERRAKEILEQVCDELAQRIGEDRAEVEELKRESAKVREELEKEREMLQVADILREERVQMKLSEAKYHFEEKNAVVERLKNELEAYLRENIGKENGASSPNYQRIRDPQAYLSGIQFGSRQKAEREETEGAVRRGELHEGDDSADSDLHSIELNMDNNSKSYKWSYGFEGNGLDNNIKGRKSLSENVEWENISLQRRNCNGMDGPNWSFIDKNHGRADVFDREKTPELGLHSQTQDYEDDIDRYRSVRILKDHILSGSKKASIQKASPTRLWGQSLPLQEPGSAVSESSPVLPGDTL